MTTPRKPSPNGFSAQIKREDPPQPVPEAIDFPSEIVCDICGEKYGSFIEDRAAGIVRHKRCATSSTGPVRRYERVHHYVPEDSLPMP